jgi:hypothetical protein
MKIRYQLRWAFACLCALLLSSSVFAQSIQLNGTSTTCQSVTLVAASSGAINLQTNPTNCLAPSIPTVATITSVSPSCANVGATVTINGFNLASASTVYVGGLNIAPTSSNATSITFVVPVGAAAGAGTIQAGTPAGAPFASFQVGGCATQAPAISSIALSSAPGVAVTSAAVGAKLTITGTNLTASTVTVIGASATVTAGSNTATQLEITVPGTPGTGTIGISNTGGTTSAPFTVTGGGGTDGTSLTGKALPIISKDPQVVPSYGDGGAGINAFDMALTNCVGSPAPIKNWRHNIDMTAYRANAALDFISIGSGQTLTYKFVAPAINGFASIATEENTQVFNPGGMLGISTRPCDFDTAKLQPGATRDYCYGISSSYVTLIYEVSNSAPTAGYCHLTPGQTYYVNYRNLKLNGGTYVDSCPTNANCGATIGFK